jgi:hypothetical protein
MIKFKEYQILSETLNATWANCDHDANYLDAYHPLMCQTKAPPFLILEVNKYYSRIPTGMQRL